MGHRALQHCLHTKNTCIIRCTIEYRGWACFKQANHTIIITTDFLSHSEQCRSYQTRCWQRLEDTQTATPLTAWDSLMTGSSWSPPLRTTANSGPSLTSRSLPRIQLGQSSVNGTMKKRRWKKKEGVRGERGGGGGRGNENYSRVYLIQNLPMIFSMICYNHFHHLYNSQWQVWHDEFVHNDEFDMSVNAMTKWLALCTSPSL